MLLCAMAIQVDNITSILDEFSHKIIEWFCKNGNLIYLLYCLCNETNMNSATYRRSLYIILHTCNYKITINARVNFEFLLNLKSH